MLQAVTLTQCASISRSFKYPSHGGWLSREGRVKLLTRVNAELTGIGWYLGKSGVIEVQRLMLIVLSLVV